MPDEPDAIGRSIIDAFVHEQGAIATVTRLHVLEATGKQGPCREMDTALLEAVFEAIIAHPRFVMEADEGRVREGMPLRTLRLRALFRQGTPTDAAC